MGFKVVTIWECQWNCDPSHTDTYSLVTEKDIEQGILEDAIFGIVKYGLIVPDSLKNN